MSNSPPEYLFVVRHGSRLDTADKSWLSTSPTPYDPPLTYGGFLQARRVGNQIANILGQVKSEDETQTTSGRFKKRKRFKVVIHSSPFLRCVQTSIGISSGLAQSLPDSTYNPADLILPRAVPQAEPQFQFKSALLRLDSFLGEWLSPEYFEMITPPPGPALMLGGAKAELLRREDYSIYDHVAEPEVPRPSSGSLWQSPTSSPAQAPTSPSTDSEGSMNVSALRSSLPTRSDVKRGYIPPRPIYAASSSGSIPDGFVAHARDAAVTVDYQWDSMRAPLDFGDGGSLGEEWASMHKRFRGGIRKLVNWYASTDSAGDLVMKPAKDNGGCAEHEFDDEEVGTVVVVVSHGAGCNALIGAITHQPVLMDIGIASITMASRKPNLDYKDLLASTPAPSDPSEKPLVAVDKMYDMRLSASTDHLRRSSASTPTSARSNFITNVWNTNNGSRGRTSTLSSIGSPVMSPFTYSDPFSSTGSRSTSASASLPPIVRQDSAPQRPLPRGPALASVGFGSTVASSNMGSRSPPATSSGFGLWSAGPPSAGPSSLRLMDDGNDDADDFSSILPDFDQKRFKINPPPKEEKQLDLAARPTSSSGVNDAPMTAEFPPPEADKVRDASTPTMFANPIRLHTNLGSDKPIEEVKVTQLGAGLGGLWGIPPPPDEAERFRDMSHTKRRWTVNERA
ncbi:phosphoglycerate mutase family protein [Metarhizium album ARSEF 1941]|uniref:Phosphoglycerate mutase family protein n=1 Tax=Metarhizium album (strain ARSEF 1941) TaxID=1081103 RepID=A0A0B2WI72_METAS|nr:phosphoglycerate mutase family protein [Metarhizium album ARSEF 1941]KHN95721.1 phosphoglycerate mutase family protein [Metarhizium album ARSEF 1941]